MNDFLVDKFAFYTGPNFYIDKPGLVFNLELAPDGPESSFYHDKIIPKLPGLENDYPNRVAELFARVVVEVNKMDLNIFTESYALSRDGEEWVVAFHALDKYLAEEVVYFVRDWFLALNDQDDSFDFEAEFTRLQKLFDKTLYGGPTIYSLVEGGIIRGIPVSFLFEENQFQWGYGKKQRRGRSTIFHTDGIKDTEFTQYKDMVGEFLDMCGFPTPQGVNCYDEEEIVQEALKLGFPVVVKPVAGHKGIGVTTGITSEEEVRKSFRLIVDAAQAEGAAFEGALVQQQIYGHDHRILTIGGKYAACLKRVPAFVQGNGKDPIHELIRVDNMREVRADTARSPLCKIKIDQTMMDFLALQNLSIDYIPSEGEEIVLRRVANISAGGVSINVTNDIHPENIAMVENIARFFHVTAMGIDVLAADISKPWQEGNFGIIEINAGPGVFMHLAPAEGGSVDVPGIIMRHFFGEQQGGGRIPIIAGNLISDKLINKIHDLLNDIKPGIGFGSVRPSGVFFGKSLFVNHSDHDVNCKILLRNPELEFALFTHNRDDIYDYGTWHEGSDVAILVHANPAEYILMRDLLPGGLLIEIREEDDDSGLTYLILSKNMSEISRNPIHPGEDADELILEALEPFLEELINKYQA